MLSLDNFSDRQLNEVSTRTLKTEIQSRKGKFKNSLLPMSFRPTGSLFVFRDI